MLNIELKIWNCIFIGGEANFSDYEQLKMCSSHDYFIAEELESALFHVQDIILIVATVLNTIAMVCFIRETPPNQSSIRVYLIFIQVTW